MQFRRPRTRQLSPKGCLLLAVRIAGSMRRDGQQQRERPDYSRRERMTHASVALKSGGTPRAPQFHQAASDPAHRTTRSTGPLGCPAAGSCTPLGITRARSQGHEGGDRLLPEPLCFNHNNPQTTTHTPDMAPTTHHRRRNRRSHHAARCLLAVAALCGSPHATQAFLVPGLHPALAPLPSRARDLGQPASASAGVGLASSSFSRLYARHMGGGVDPPFQFGGTCFV